jgi:hypothetical protein
MNNVNRKTRKIIFFQKLVNRGKNIEKGTSFHSYLLQRATLTAFKAPGYTETAYRTGEGICAE